MNGASSLLSEDSNASRRMRATSPARFSHIATTHRQGILRSWAWEEGAMQSRLLIATIAVVAIGCGAEETPEETAEAIAETADPLTCSRLARGQPCALHCLIANMDCLARASHPKKHRYRGDGPLTACHKHEGYYSCVYVYPNGDVCTYSYDSTRPPFCKYER